MDLTDGGLIWLSKQVPFPRMSVPTDIILNICLSYLGFFSKFTFMGETFQMSISSYLFNYS